jgi:predicted sulfurtransferase
VGAAASTTPAPPFTNLHIRVRQQVVTDGLEQAYDWQNAGTSQTKNVHSFGCLFGHETDSRCLLL